MHDADLAANLRTMEVRVLPEDLQGARGARRDARDHAHGRRLPCAVSPKEAEELAVTHLKVDTSHGRPRPEDLRQASGADQRGRFRCGVGHTHRLDLLRFAFDCLLAGRGWLTTLGAVCTFGLTLLIGGGADL